MSNNKSPGNDGLKKNFAELFRKKKKNLCVIVQRNHIKMKN